MANVDFKELEKFAEQLGKIEKEQLDRFSEDAVKELAARLIRKVRKTTPVGDYPKETGKKGGTLRRGWTKSEAVKDGGTYKVDVINEVEYASYVEYGHRGVYVPALGKTLHLDKRWTPGHFMLTNSEKALEREAPRLLGKKLTKFLGDAFK